MQTLFMVIFTITLLVKNSKSSYNNWTKLESELMTCNNSSSLCNYYSNRREIIGNDGVGIPRCRCDSRCMEYGDCCFDAVRRETSQERDGSNNGIIKKNNKWKCGFIDSNQQMSVYMINSCLDSYADDFVANKCERRRTQLPGEPISTYEYLMDVPARGMDDGVFYSNVYCARCNGVTKVTPTTFEMSCWYQESKDHNRTAINASECREMIRNGSLPYRPGKLLWTANERYSAEISVRHLIDYSVAIRGQRECFANVFDSCLRYKSVSHLVRPCKLYSNVLLSLRNNRLYRNQYCAECNKATLNLTCDLWLQKTEPETESNEAFSVTKTVPFSFLVDFNEGACTRCEFYDPLEGACKRLSCEDGDFSARADCFRVILRRGDYVKLDNGSVYVNETRAIFTPDQYEVYREEDGSILICEELSRFVLNNYDINQQVLTVICLSLSIICLSIHVLIYALLPKMKNLPGKNLLSLSVALIAAQSTFLFGVGAEVDRLWCYAIGVFIHYLFLSTFFWMHILSLDICLTFTTHRTVTPASSTTRFIRYSLFSWLSPALIVIIAVIVDVAAPRDSSLRPSYGERLCYMNHRNALVLFFTLPLLIILSINLFLFTLTSFTIWKTAKIAKFARSQKDDGCRFLLYAKLCFIMGGTWIVAFLAPIANEPWVWYLFTVLNGMQGVFIFGAFSCKPSVFRMIRQLVSKKKTKVKKSSLSTSETNMTSIRTTIDSSQINTK